MNLYKRPHYKTLILNMNRDRLRKLIFASIAIKFPLAKKYYAMCCTFLDIEDDELEARVA